MRPVLLLVALPALVLAQTEDRPGSIEKLLDRVAGEKKIKFARDLESHHDVRNELIKRGLEDKVRRWVWGNSIIQDGSPTQGLPAPGVNANLLPTGNTVPVNTPANLNGLVTPSILPQASIQPLLSAPAPAPSAAPSSAGPPVPVQQSAPAPSTAPANMLGVPFVPSSSVAAVRSKLSSSAAPVFTMKNRGGVRHGPVVGLRERGGRIVGDDSKLLKKWVWGTSIIQDNSPTVGVPPVGQNGNLLTGQAGKIPVTTPTNVLVAPSFPPKPSKKAAPTPVKAVQGVPQKIASQASTVAAAVTSKAAQAKSSAKKHHHHHHHHHKSSGSNAAPSGAPATTEQGDKIAQPLAAVVGADVNILGNKRTMRRVQKAGAGVIEQQ